MTYPNKVATIFGGTGFLGRHLVRRLAADGWTLRIATRHTSKALFLKTSGSVGQIVPVAIDVRSDADLAAAIAGADLVVNLIGILAEGGGATFRRVHAELPGRIGAAASAAGVGRVVQISALGADSKAGSAYARSKAQGEAALSAAFPAATILRPSIVFGPEDRFFNRFASLTRISPFLPLIGGGATKLQPVWVGDVASAIERVAKDESTAGRTYEVAGPRVYSFRELMELLLAEIRRQRLLLSIPFGIASLQARFLELVPGKPLTRDQVETLKSDNIATGAPGLRALGIEPAAVELILPTYLDRFRKGGRFSNMRDYTVR